MNSIANALIMFIALYMPDFKLYTVVLLEVLIVGTVLMWIGEEYL